MPHAVDWSPEHRLVTCRIGGHVSGDAVCAAIDEVATRLQGEDDVVHVCWDARGLESLSVSPAELAHIVQHMNRFTEQHPRGRTAIVATRLVDQTLAQLLVLKGPANGRGRSVFTTMDEAIAWVVNPSAPDVPR